MSAELMPVSASEAQQNQLHLVPDLQQNSNTSHAPAHAAQGESYGQVSYFQTSEAHVPRHHEAQDRLAVRFANGAADIATRVAGLSERFATHMNSRRTTSEVATDVRQSAAEKVEAGKKIAEQVGVTVVAHAIVAGSTLKSNVETNFGELKTSGHENVNKFKSFLHRRAEAGRARKDQVVTAVKQRTVQGARIVGRGYEVTNDRFNQSIRVGHEALKYAALVPVGATIIGAEAGARVAVHGAKKVGEGYNASKTITGNTVNRTHAAATEKQAAIHSYTVKRSERKTNKIMFQEANRMNREFDARERAKAIRKKVS